MQRSPAMPRAAASSTSSTHDRAPLQQKPPSLIQTLCCCCNVNEVMDEVQMTAAALNKPPPLQLEPGHANEEGESRGMAAPKWGCVEIVNKNKEGEIIAVLVAQNAHELVADGRDPNGYVNMYLRMNGCMPDQTVVNGSFDDGVDVLQFALFYGCKYKTIEKARAGNIRDNFEFLKLYEVRCRGKNVLLKYKLGDLELQRGASAMAFLGKKHSVGGGIDMKTNVERLTELPCE